MHWTKTVTPKLAKGLCAWTLAGLGSLPQAQTITPSEQVFLQDMPIV